MTPDRRLTYDELSRKRRRAAARRMARQNMRKRQEDAQDREIKQVVL